MNIKYKYPALSYLLVSYFNQDFEVLFGNADDTLEVYKSTETKEERSQIKSEIDNLLALSLSDYELQDIILNQIDCNYYYPDEWATSEEWLKHIRNFMN